MLRRVLSPGRAPGALLLAAAALTASCRDPVDPTAPSLAATPQSTDPTVTGVEPDSSKRGVRLALTVSGTGFDKGSVVTLERQGVPAFGVTTNATDFVNHMTLNATITIAADADTGKLDVAVLTSKGRKGVGIELFVIEYQLAELGMFGGTWSAAHAITDQGEVVGVSCTQDCLSRAFYWTDAGGMENLGTLPDYSRSAAYAITARGEVFGQVECRPGDPGCPEDDFPRRMVRWDRMDGEWQITALQGCSASVVDILGDFTQRFVVNDHGQCVGGTWQSTYRQLFIQTLSGGAVTTEEPLPLLVPESSAQVYAINNVPLAVGSAKGSRSFLQPVVWYRGGSGSWVVLALPFPEDDFIARATDISEPDASGVVRVAGYTEHNSVANRRRYSRPVRWTLEPDGLGAWRVASMEILEHRVPRSNGYRAYAGAINDAGDMVGVAGEIPDAGAPAKWPLGGSVEVLPVPNGSVEARPLAINNRGWIIGAVWDQVDGCTRAAVWWQP